MQRLSPQGIGKKIDMRELVKDFWNPPLEGFLKYNIDGASKGNPGMEVVGGVLRDENRSIISLFYGHLGKATNNMVELMALEQGPKFLK